MLNYAKIGQECLIERLGLDKVEVDLFAELNVDLGGNLWVL